MIFWKSRSRFEFKHQFLIFSKLISRNLSYQENQNSQRSRRQNRFFSFYLSRRLYRWIWSSQYQMLHFESDKSFCQFHKSKEFKLENDNKHIVYLKRWSRSCIHLWRRKNRFLNCEFRWRERVSLFFRQLTSMNRSDMRDSVEVRMKQIEEKIVYQISFLREWQLLLMKNDELLFLWHDRDCQFSENQKKRWIKQKKTDTTVLMNKKEDKRQRDKMMNEKEDERRRNKIMMFVVKKKKWWKKQTEKW